MTIILTTLFFLIMISFSRTNILITLVIIIYPYISKLINFKTQLFLVSVLIIIPVFFGSFLNVAIPEEGASNFLSKVLNSYSEIIVRDYRDSDALAPDANLINLYWRSQEAFLGLAKYTEGVLMNSYLVKVLDLMLLQLVYLRISFNKYLFSIMGL